MKRISIIFLLPALLLSACGQSAGSASKAAADLTLDDIVSANSGSALIEKYSVLSVDYTEYDLNGSSVYTQRAQIKSVAGGDYIYCADYGGQGSELETGGIYCVFDGDTGDASLYALTPETYASDMSDMLSSFVFSSADGEKITSASESGDGYVVETSAPAGDDVKEYLNDNYGVTPDSLVYRSVLRKSDLVMTSSSTYAVCGKDKYKIADFTHTYGGTFTVPDFADKLVNSADSKITVMLGDKVCCEYSVPSGTSLLTDYFSYDGYVLSSGKNGGGTVSSLEAGKTYYLIASD